MIIVALLAAAIIGHPTPVTCNYTATQHAGYYDGQTISLQPMICAGLSRYATDKQLAVSIFVIAHEAEHAVGVTDEHEADCRALPWVARLARRFFSASPIRQWRLAMIAVNFHLSQPEPYGGQCF